MPVHTSDLPGTTPNKPEPEDKQAEKIEKLEKKSADVLAAAAESSNAEVQNLLGHRVIAVQNQDEDAIKDIDNKLGNLLNK